MERLEIKSLEDRLTVAKILVANGYTVRIVTVKDEGKKQAVVLQFEKNNKRVVEA